MYFKDIDDARASVPEYRRERSGRRMIDPAGDAQTTAMFPAGPESARVLIYSHDTFGLGHLRRSRAIANALVEERPGVSVIILSGSPVIGSFDFGSGVDYVRIPGVTKLPDGDYRALNLNMSVDEAVRLRADLILQTAETFRPDLLIVDKEPTGFRGELMPALEHLRQDGCRLVLGIRDVL